jgi:hypothetical protein
MESTAILAGRVMGMKSLRVFLILMTVCILVSGCSWFKKDLISFKGLKKYNPMNLFKDDEIDRNCIDGDCVNGHGTYVYIDGRKYTGDFKDGLWHGQGTLYVYEGKQYTGTFREGEFVGNQMYAYEDTKGKSVGKWFNQNLKKVGKWLWLDKIF